MKGTFAIVYYSLYSIMYDETSVQSKEFSSSVMLFIQSQLFSR